jgi:predicted ATPase
VQQQPAQRPLHHHKEGVEFYDHGYYEGDNLGSPSISTSTSTATTNAATRLEDHDLVKVLEVTNNKNGGRQQEEEEEDDEGDPEGDQPALEFQGSYFCGRDRELQLLHNLLDEISIPQKGGGRNSSTSTLATTTTSTTTTSTTKPSSFSSTSSSLSTTLRPSSSSTFSGGARVVLLSGYSGTGKSTLVHHFVQSLAAVVVNGHEEEKYEARPIYFMAGKYTEYHHQENGGGGSGGGGGVGATDGNPFSAIIDALSDFIQHQNQQNGGSELEKIRKKLRRAKLGPEEIQVLTSIVPALSKVLPNNNKRTVSSSTTLYKQKSKKKDKSTTTTTNRATTPSRTLTGPTLTPASTAATSSPSTQRDITTTSTETAWNRLRYIFQRFIQALCTPQRPLIFLLDDLQWADSASLDLLVSLLTDQTLNHLLFIGTHRPVSSASAGGGGGGGGSGCNASVNSGKSHGSSYAQNRSFLEFLELLEQRKRVATAEDIKNNGSSNIASGTEEDVESTRSPPATLYQVELLNLSMLELGQFIANRLHRSTTEEVQSLTAAIYNKTRGNMFFTIQLLQQLQRRNVFYFCTISFYWEWKKFTQQPQKSTANDEDDTLEDAPDEDDLSTEVLFSENVIDAVVSKLQEAPKAVQTALILAAFTKSTFTVEVLYLLWTRISVPLPHAPSQQQQQNAQNDAMGMSRDQHHPQHSNKRSQQREELIRILDTAVFESLLTNTVGSEVYKFAHDRIQQAACFLVPVGPERTLLCWQLGQQLYEMYKSAENMALEEDTFRSKDDEDYDDDDDDMCDSATVTVPRVGEDWMLFVSADHLNKSTTTSFSASTSTLLPASGDQPTKQPSVQQLLEKEQQRHSFLALVNLEAGEKACSLAAFRSASKYLQRGLDQLEKLPGRPTAASSSYCWEQEYEVSLRLYRARAEAALCLGNFALGAEMAQQVLDHAVTLHDRLPTQFSLAKAIGRQNLHAQSFQMNRDALLSLKVYPKRCYVAHILKHIFLIKRYLQRHSDEDILRLPFMTDSSKLHAMRFFSQASSRAYISQNKVEFLLSAVCQIRLSFKHGLCGDLASGIVSFGVFLGLLGDQPGALRMGRLARQILLVTRAKHLEGWVLVTSALFIESWSAKSIKDVLPIMQRAARSAMETGDFEVAYYGIQSAHLTSYDAGYSLQDIETQGNHTTRQAKFYEVSSQTAAWVEVHRTIQYLTGSPRPIDWNQLSEFGSDLSEFDDSIILMLGYLARVQLGFYFGQFEFAESMLEKLVIVSTKAQSACLILPKWLFGSLVCLALTRTTGLAKYTVLATKYLQHLKRSIERRALGCHSHRLLLVEADLLATTTMMGKEEASSATGKRVREAYDDAICAAQDVSHVHHAAIGCELAASYCWRIGDMDSHGRYKIQAIKLYGEWGATAKVKLLEEHQGATL